MCSAPDGTCQDGTCNRDENYCFDPQDPCRGFFCGGSDRGVCVVDMGNDQPTCSCFEGFENETFSLYCCPTDPALDPTCAQEQSGG